jgi:hypothetical protein
MPPLLASLGVPGGEEISGGGTVEEMVEFD